MIVFVSGIKGLSGNAFFGPILEKYQKLKKISKNPKKKSQFSKIIIYGRAPQKTRIKRYRNNEQKDEF